MKEYEEAEIANLITEIDRYRKLLYKVMKSLRKLAEEIEKELFYSSNNFK